MGVRKLRAEHCMFLPFIFTMILAFTFITYHVQVFVYRQNEELRPKCNGYWFLCNRRYNEIAHPTTHSSFSVGTNMLANQVKSIEDQLNDGVRAFMWDPAYRDPKKQDNIDLCLRRCIYMDGGSLQDNLLRIKDFLTIHPREVITIFLRSVVPSPKIAEVFKSVGMDKTAYAHPLTAAVWPTMQNLIDLKKRLVVFIDVDVDYSRWPWLMRQADFVFETPRIIRNATQLTDESFSCSIETPKDTFRPLSIINHFITIEREVDEEKDDYPDLDQAVEMNSRDPILKRASTCLDVIRKQATVGSVSSGKFFPNFIAVDFYHVPVLESEDLFVKGGPALMDVCYALNTEYYAKSFPS